MEIGAILTTVDKKKIKVRSGSRTYYFLEIRGVVVGPYFHVFLGMHDACFYLKKLFLDREWIIPETFLRERALAPRKPAHLAKDLPPVHSQPCCFRLA